MKDIYVTHDWRECAERSRALALLDAVYGLRWRNFGTPWFDPILQLTSERGAAIVRVQTEEQVRGAAIVLLLPGVYTGSKRGTTWVGHALQIARGLGLPILGLLPEGTAGVEALDPALRALADRWVPWEEAAVREAVETMSAAAA